MSAMERFAGLDAMLAEVRAEHQEETNALNTRIQTLEIENEMLRAQNAASREAEKAAERIATKFITQFGSLRLIVDEVGMLAEAIENDRKRTQEPEHKEPPHGLESARSQEGGNAGEVLYTEEPSGDDAPSETPVPNGAGAGAWSGKGGPTPVPQMPPYAPANQPVPLPPDFLNRKR